VVVVAVEAVVMAEVVEAAVFLARRKRLNKNSIPSVVGPIK